MSDFLEGAVTSPMAATFGLLLTAVWLCFFRTVPLEKSKDRAVFCFLHASALYVFLGLLAISIVDWKLLSKMVSSGFAQGELIAIFFAASFEAFTAVIRVCKNQSTLDE